VGYRLKFTDVLQADHQRGHRRTDLGSFERSFRAEITNAYRLTEDIGLYHVSLTDPGENAGFSFRPGQFVMLEVPGVGEAPFSISSSPMAHGNLELCIRAVGNLTRFLSRAGRGLEVGIRGPFGTAFPVEEMHGNNVLLIAGGLGLAPLRSPLSYVLEHRGMFRDVDVIYGTRTPADLLFTYQYETWRMFDIGLHVIVERPDEAWRGPVGLTTDVLKDLCEGEDCAFKDTYAIVCGPPVMFKFVCGMLTEAGIPMHKMFVSLERRMHCGMGKCCRCNVGSTYTCLEGPVFDYWTVMNLKEAI
jgi:NAD(P)H-flavin reductase